MKTTFICLANSYKDYLKTAPELYLCLSLGILHEGLHYKLVAGVIPGQ